MKTSIKTFTCVAMATMLLFACNNRDDEEDAQNQKIVCTNANPLECYACTEGILECSPTKQPPYDSAIIIINPDVREWAEEQLSSANNEKKLINIFDMYSTGGKRDLYIPGEIRLDLLDSPYGWVALMTAEEIQELIKKYNNLAIEFYSELIIDLSFMSVIQNVS